MNKRLDINKKLTLVLLIGLLLNGCSKPMEHAENDAASPQAQQRTSNEINDTTPSPDPSVDTQPATTDKPQQILDASINPAEQYRRMVRQAGIDFTTQDLIKTTLAIDKLSLDAGGLVEQKNISYAVSEYKQQYIGDGKIKIFEKVEPFADIIVRIPSEKTAAYVNQLLPLMFFLNQQQYSAKRYELTLLEQKIQQTQRVEQNTPNPQRNEIDRLTQLEVNDRVRYSTIQLNIHQPATVRERIDIDIAAVTAQHGNSFWQRAWQGLYTGWYFILNLVIFLITIWPIYLIVVLLLLAYRLIKPYYNKFSTIRQHSNNQHNKPEDPKDNTKDQSL